MRRGTWRVADFHRQGQSARDHIYPTVRGQQTRQGLTVKVVGADVRPKGTVLVLEIRNTTTLMAGGGNPVIRDAAGRKLPTQLGTDVVLLTASKRSTTRSGLYFQAGLPAGSRTFDLLIDFQLGCNPVCKISTSMDIPVQLVQ